MGTLASQYVAVSPGAAMTADSAAAIAANAAACYTVKWEKPLLTVEEKADPTARFRIVSKIKGLCMRDTDEDYDDYRMVNFGAR